MANQEQVEILKQGDKVWNEWRKNNPDAKIDLTRAIIRDIDLVHSNLFSVNLARADLRGTSFLQAHLDFTCLVEANMESTSLLQTNLMGSNLSRAVLKKARLWNVNAMSAKFRSTDLKNANLNFGDFRFANFWKADFSGAYLQGADFSRAKLKESNLTATVLGNTIFAFADLSEVIGIEETIHSAPSNIGIESIQLWKGKVYEKFLRGCGLSDIQIESLKLNVPGLDSEQVGEITSKIFQLYLGGAIQFYSCFISYSSKDQEFTQKLHDDLQNKGIRCWFDREDLRIGDAIRPTINRQIRLRDKLLVILSENSIKSEWVGDEVEGALEEEQKSNRSVLFPIRLDDTVLNARDDWAAKIKRRRHIGDFSNWKDKNSYQKAFERLLRDLKATE